MCPHLSHKKQVSIFFIFKLSNMGFGWFCLLAVTISLLLLEVPRLISFILTWCSCLLVLHTMNGMIFSPLKLIFYFSFYFIFYISWVSYYSVLRIKSNIFNSSKPRPIIASSLTSLPLAHGLNRLCLLSSLSVCMLFLKTGAPYPSDLLVNSPYLPNSAPVMALVDGCRIEGVSLLCHGRSPTPCCPCCSTAGLWTSSGHRDGFLSVAAVNELMPEWNACSHCCDVETYSRLRTNFVYWSDPSLFFALLGSFAAPEL